MICTLVAATMLQCSAEVCQVAPRQEGKQARQTSAHMCSKGAPVLQKPALQVLFKGKPPVVADSSHSDVFSNALAQVANSK